jgi:hypothetical protein
MQFAREGERMSWLSILGVVVVLVGLVSVFGATPKGGRPASRTRLMSAARFVLVLIGIVLIWAGWAG